MSKKISLLLPFLLSYGIAAETQKVPKLQKEFEQSKQKEQSEFYGEPNSSDTSLQTTKTSCVLQSEYKNKSQEDLKKIVLVKAKAEALEEIYGTMMNTKTELKNGRLIDDQIEQIASGLVRIKGNVKYHNGENLGEICATLTAYATKDDLKKYEDALANQSHKPIINDTPQENIFTENGILAYFYDKDDLALENPLHQAVLKTNFNLSNTPFLNKTLKSGKIYKVILSGFIKSDGEKNTVLKIDADVYDFSLYINEQLVSQTNNQPIDIELKNGYNSIKVIARTSDSYDIAINRLDVKKRKETPLQLTELYYDTSKVKKF
jgi:hypothetical protein